MMDKKRIFFWTVFFGAVGVVAAIPEFMTKDAQSAVPVSRPAPLAGLRASAAASVIPHSPVDETPVPVELAAIDLFAAKSWYLPPPPPLEQPAPPLPPPPPPAAPPLPFKFMGKFDDAVSVKAFLQRDEKVYTVGVGDVIDGIYRVTGINGGQITLIYLPLEIAQTLAAGSAL